jgi:hypothetical protein
VAHFLPDLTVVATFLITVLFMIANWAIEVRSPAEATRIFPLACVSRLALGHRSYCDVSEARSYFASSQFPDSCQRGWSGFCDFSSVVLASIKTSVPTVHRPGDDPRKECEECGNARGSNVRYYPT